MAGRTNYDEIKKIKEIKIVKEKPLFTLVAESGWSDEKEIIKIYAKDLQEAKVGTKWNTHSPCGRDSIEQELSVIYKDEGNNRLLCLLTTYETTDTPNPEEFITREFYWVELA